MTISNANSFDDFKKYKLFQWPIILRNLITGLNKTFLLSTSMWTQPTWLGNRKKTITFYQKSLAVNLQNMSQFPFVSIVSKCFT